MPPPHNATCSMRPWPASAEATDEGIVNGSIATQIPKRKKVKYLPSRLLCEPVLVPFCVCVPNSNLNGSAIESIARLTIMLVEQKRQWTRNR
eukprot:scaffold148007_cov23-Prasinocladus_malaysianus.AAC.1